jgi:hypothetical protein
MLPRADFLPEQWWNGHAHLAHQIGSMALQHRDMGNGFPSELTHAEWQAILTRIGEPLMAYATRIDDLEGAGERKSAARDALELFTNWFDHFWD